MKSRILLGFAAIGCLSLASCYPWPENNGKKKQEEVKKEPTLEELKKQKEGEARKKAEEDALEQQREAEKARQEADAKQREEAGSNWQADFAASSDSYKARRRNKDDLKAVKIDARQIREDGTVEYGGKTLKPVRLWSTARKRYEMAIPVEEP